MTTGPPKSRPRCCSLSGLAKAEDGPEKSKWTSATMNQIAGEKRGSSRDRRKIQVARNPCLVVLRNPKLMNTDETEPRGCAECSQRGAPEPSAEARACDRHHRAGALPRVSAAAHREGVDDFSRAIHSQSGRKTWAFPPIILTAFTHSSAWRTFFLARKRRPAQHPYSRGHHYQRIRKICASYEEEITGAEESDLQILGIGRNGHIGFQ